MISMRKNTGAFPDLDFKSSDYERAAEIFNACLALGIQGSNTDFLLCSVAELRGLALFTTDKDFHRMQIIAVCNSMNLDLNPTRHSWISAAPKFPLFAGFYIIPLSLGFCCGITNHGSWIAPGFSDRSQCTFELIRNLLQSFLDSFRN